MKKWFARHGISLFPHPTNSPDLSAIEPIWHILKRRINARKHLPASIDELEHVVHEEWAMIPQRIIDNYILAMPRQIRAVYKAKGGPIGV